MSAELKITDAAKARINERREQIGKPDFYLQILVEGGGCSGYQYKMEWVDSVSDDAIVIDEMVITDDISLPLLAGSEVDFVRSLMGENFHVHNPNATQGCGCGSSFSIG